MLPSRPSRGILGSLFLSISRRGLTGQVLGDVHSSGKAMNLQPAWPASLIQWIVRRTDSSRLNQPGSALTAAALNLDIVLVWWKWIGIDMDTGVERMLS